MKELRSRKHPGFQPHIVTDEQYEEMVRTGFAKRFTVREIEEIKKTIVIPKSVEVIKKKGTKKKIDD